MMHIVGAMRTHVGAVRSDNEDTVVFVVPGPRDAADARGALLLVADGMGGHAAGGLASAMTAEIMRHTFEMSDAPPPEVLGGGFAAANAAVFRHGSDHPGCAGMGTTCTALLVRDNHAFLGHVGDSRAYLLRDGHLRQLSTDHSLVGALVRSGALSPAEAAASPERHVLLKALGTEAAVEPELWHEGMELQAGDRIILCSDGLTDLVPDARIREAAAEGLPHEACETLLAEALAAGGHDNISVGVFSLQQEAPNPAIRPTRGATAACEPDRIAGRMVISPFHNACTRGRGLIKWFLARGGTSAAGRSPEVSP